MLFARRRLVILMPRRLRSATKAPRPIHPAERAYKILARSALIGLPASYLFGFIAWGAYSMDLGLGFRSRPAEQYLAAGIPVTLLLSAYTIATGFLFLSWSKQSQFKRWPAAGQAIVDAVTHGFVAWLMTSLVLSLCVFFRMLDVTKIDIQWMALMLGLLAAFLSLVGSLAVAGHYGWRLGIHWLGRLLRRGPQPKPEAMEHEPISRWAAMAFVGFLVVVTIGPTLLPAVRSPMGGGHESHAYLDLDRTQLAVEMREALLPANHSANETVVRSVQLTVFSATSDGFVVRVTGKDTPSDRLHEIPTSVIRGITWIDQG